MSQCALYRHFDEAGVLLYVGISDAPANRGKQHSRGASWMDFAKRLEGVWYPNRVSAAAAETKAIETEGPVFNVQDAPGDQKARVETYLRSRQFGFPYRKREPEELVTLREAAREGWVVKLSLRDLRRARSEPMEFFPQHAGRTRWFTRLYSAEELEDWTEGLGGTTLNCTRSELRDLRRSYRRRQRQRTRGERPAPCMTTEQWRDARARLMAES